MKSELKIRAALDIMGIYEVSWFGIIVKTDKENTYKLIDIMFPPQINRTTFVETDDEKFPQWYYETFIKNNNPFLIRLHGHTHPTFGVTPSGTDIVQFKQIMEEVEDFYFQFIINKQMNVFCKYHDKKSNTALDVNVIFEFSDQLKNILNDVTKKQPILIDKTTLTSYRLPFSNRPTLFDDGFDYEEDIYQLGDIGGVDPYEP